MKPLVLTAGVLAMAFSVVGCSAPAAPDETAEPVTVDVPAASPTAEPSDADAASCVAFADVLTIITTAENGLQSGRMLQQEYDGWYRLATRVLDRVPTTGQGAVSDAVTALKGIAPPIPSGTMASSGINTEEWYAAMAPLGEACTAAGGALTVESYIGG